MAYAGFRFAEALLQAKFNGKSGIIEDTCAERVLDSINKLTNVNRRHSPLRLAERRKGA